MAGPPESLFAAVRGSCSATEWSRGVELTRANAVSLEHEDGEELRFQVSRQGGMISRTVRLFPEDDDWECGCNNEESACAHVAAAVISWKRSQELDGAAQRPRTGRIGYRLGRDQSRLTLRRVVVTGEEEHDLISTLAALAEGKVEGPSFVASQADLASELTLGTHRHGPLPRQLIPKLFRRLAHCSDVRLEGRQLQVDADPLTRIAVVEDHGEGFRVAVIDDPDLKERFSNGACLCNGRLRPEAETRLTGAETEELERGRFFGPSDLPLLITELLPSLRKRIRVVVRTERLPETTQERPRITLELRRSGETLSVLATIVYGRPPSARVAGGRLILLGGVVPLRDEPRERALQSRLHRALGLTPGFREEYVGEAAVAFAARLEGWDGEIVGEAHTSFHVAPPLVPRLTVGGGGFRVEFESMELDGVVAGRRHGAADPASVMRAWSAGEQLVPLLEGGWAALPVDWLERFGHRIADLLAAQTEQGDLPRSSLPDLARLCEELEQPIPPEFDQLRALVDGFAGIPPTEVPAGVTATLRDYQKKGVDWLFFMRRAGLGALLADDMGLGKTLQALCSLEGRTLVVAPTSVLHNWVDEIQRFRPTLSCHVYHGAGRELAPAADVTLTTYAILRLDAQELAAEPWETIVLDEAQAIKNPQSQVAQAAYALRGSCRLTLTGTPVENRLEELWSQLHFLNPGLLGGRRDFQERYADPIAAGDETTATRLRQRIRPFIMRRMKQEVAPELPPRTESVLRCELSTQEREIYDSIRAATLRDVVERLQSGGGVLAALEALLRLRQAACHSGLIPGQEARSSSKLKLLLEALENVVSEGHKALVFSQWTSLLDLTEPELHDAGIEFLRLDGSTRDRAAVVRSFQDAKHSPPVLLISLKAGGTGLNLTAADHVFLLDPWWNPAVEDQAADRVHRIGQDRPVMVYRLVAEETVEERILDLQARKRQLAASALSGAEAARGIGREDLLALLE